MKRPVLKQANEIIKAASLAYRAGEISFAELSQFSYTGHRNSKITWRINVYNHSVIQYNYYINQ